jgi:hypothetical protein
MMIFYLYNEVKDMCKASDARFLSLEAQYQDLKLLGHCIIIRGVVADDR